MRTVPDLLPDITLVSRLEAALACSDDALDDLAGAGPIDDRDGALALARIHDLHLGPLPLDADRARRQHHLTVAGLKWRLEADFLDRLEVADAGRGRELPEDPLDALRTLQATDRVPPLYAWLATRARPAEVRAFLELEGGPDGGFDDLVAQCQVGISGDAKVEMARNFWDEMGRGDPTGVHTELHRTMTAALGLRPPARTELPGACLDRVLLGTTLATNRWLQPEMIGALGLIELQAGPRCRQVVAALRRIDAPDDAFPFYVEHARTDPHHGRAWLDHVVAPLVADRPAIGRRVVRGARWRSTVDARFLAAVQDLLGVGPLPGSPGPADGDTEAVSTAPVLRLVDAAGSRRPASRSSRSASGKGRC